MKDILLKTLVIAYGVTAVVDIVAYWPTIKDLYYHKKASANISSFLLWTITTGIAFLYSIFILSDILLRVVSGMIFFSNALVLILSLSLRNR